MCTNYKMRSRMHAWNRLDAGWEDHAESGIRSYYNEAMNELSHMAAMLEQIHQALEANASEIEASDQKMADLFGNLAIQSNSGKPPGLAKMIAPGQESPPVSALEELLREMLDGMCPTDPTPLLDAIHNATLAERQAILNDLVLMGMIQKGLGALAPVYIAALLEGALYWPRGSWPNTNSQIYVGTDMDPANNDFWGDNYSAFAQWLRGGEESTNRPDTLTGTMNCWEGEEVSTNERAQAMINAYYDTLGAELGVNDATAWQHGDSAPPAGSLIFFNGLEHVAISTGRTNNGEVEIMSLWIYPDESIFQNSTLRAALP
ncbi:MAG: WXG100 family type VII secretion target [Chloroflexota bacterium]